MTKLEAIAFLESALANNPKFKKKWKEYIELCIVDELEKNNVLVPTGKLRKLVEDSSASILRLFSQDWWSAQGLK